MEKMVEDIDHLIVAQRNLLRRTAGMLNHSHVFVDQYLALLFIEGQQAIGRQLDGPIDRHRANGDQGKVQGLVGEEELVGIEPEDNRRARVKVLVVLIIEIDQAAAGIVGLSQDMVVGEQQGRRDDKSGAKTANPAAEVANLDAADGAAAATADVQKVHFEQVARAQDTLQPLSVVGMEHFAAAVAAKHFGKVDDALGGVVQFCLAFGLALAEPAFSILIELLVVHRFLLMPVT